jgi:hypothetical protein
VEEAKNEYAEIDNADAMVASAELEDAARQ